MDNKEIIKNISSNLKKLRTSRKNNKNKPLTQEELIQEIGCEKVSLRSYRTYESGNSTRVPYLEKLVPLAEYFGVSLDYLVFNKSSSFDDSYTKRDSLKRLSRLIYSLVLRPVKETNPDSPYYGRYLFLAYDRDVTVFIDKFETYMAEKNSLFEYKNICEYKGINDFDCLLDTISDIEEDWSPSLSRLNSLLVESGIDPEEYANQYMSRLNKSRAAAKYKMK